MHRNLTVTPTKRQLLWGLIYLPVELIVLPVVLALFVILIPVALTDGQLNGIYFTLNFLVVLLIFHNFLLKDLCRCAGRIGKILGAAGLGFLMYMGANFVLSILILRLDPNFANVNDAAIADMAASDYWIIAFCTVFLVPVTEELLFRGVLFAGLYNRSRIAAYAVSAAMFCAVHVIGYIGTYPLQTLLLCLLQYIPPSLCLGWAYAKSDSVIAPVLIHTLVNALGVLSMR